MPFLVYRPRGVQWSRLGERERFFEPLPRVVYRAEEPACVVVSGQLEGRLHVVVTELAMTEGE